MRKLVATFVCAALLIFSLATIAALTDSGPFHPEETSAQATRELSALCANRYNGDLRDGSRRCASTEVRLDIPDDYPIAICANRYNGDLRYSRAGRCASTEILFQMPNAGNLPICVNRYNGDLRYSRTGRCASTETGAIIVGQQAPVANDDGPYTTEVNVDIQIETSDPNDLLDNDQLGLPAGVISTFGGGSLGGAVTDNAADSSIGLAGGMLTVNTDGGFSLTNPSVTGAFTFDYRVTNSVGSSDATVSIQIQGPPDAVNDGPASDSVVGDDFHTAVDQLLVSNLSDNLLSNDTLGFPEGTVTFAGHDGSAGDTAFGGNVSVEADGDFTYTPPTGFVGLDSFVYTLTNTIGADDATVTIAVGDRPQATSDTYGSTVLGNVAIDTTTSSGFTVLTNDTGDEITVTTFDSTSANGGTVSLNANGTFSYNPAPGFEGNDTFTYTIDNGFNDPQVGAVSLTVDGMIWFIDSSASTNGDGHLNSPFNCLVGTSCFSDTAADDSGDAMFVYEGSYTGGLTLLDDQFFIGQGASSSITAITSLSPPADSPPLPATGGTRPTVGVSSTTTNITIASGNLIQGLALRDGNGIAGTGVATGTIREVDIQTSAGNTIAGVGINLDTTSGTFTIDGLSATRLDQPIVIQNATGTVDFDGTTTVNNYNLAGVRIFGGSASVSFNNLQLVGASGDGFVALDSSGPITVAGSLSITNGGKVVSLDNLSGGADFSGATVSANIGTAELMGSSGTYTFGSISLEHLVTLLTLQNNPTAMINIQTLALTATGNAATAALVGNSGTVNINDAGASSATISASGGPAIDASGTTINAVLDGASSSSSSADAIRLNNIAGSIAIQSGSITAPTGQAIEITNSSLNFSYAGTINKINNAATGIQLSGNTSGTTTIGGAVTLSTSTATAVNLLNNTGYTVRFSGGLDIDTSNGVGFNAAGGGTVEVLNTLVTNTVTSTTGIAVNIQDTIIGVEGVSFQSVSVNGAPNGIVLDDTGSSGTFSITGTGGTCTTASPTCTGGDIRSTSGANGSTAGRGISLNNVAGGVTLSHLRIRDNSNFAVFGSNVTDFELNSSLIDGTNGDDVDLDEGAIVFEGLFGASSISNSEITGGVEDNVRVHNSSGVLDRLIISNTTIRNNSDSLGNDGLRFATLSTAPSGTVMNLTVESSTFSAHRGDHFDADVAGSAQMDIVFSGNTLSGGHSNSLGQGVHINNSGNANVTLDVSGNNITGAVLSAFTFFQSASSTTGSSMIGTLDDNGVGSTGQAGSGSQQGSGVVINTNGNGTVTMALTNNDVRQYVEHGIRVLAGDGNPDVNVTITGNTVKEPSGSFPLNGIHVQAGKVSATDTFTMCVDIGGAGALGNDVVGGGNNVNPGEEDIRVRQRFGTTIALPGYTGGLVETYIQDRNTGTPTVGVVGTTFTSGICALP